MTTKWKCPSVVKVVGLDYRISLDPIHCADEKVCGDTNNRAALIHIDPTMPEQLQRITLLHEVLHAICYQFGICNLIDSKNEEMVVNAISNGLFDIIREDKCKF